RPRALRHLDRGPQRHPHRTRRDLAQLPRPGPPTRARKARRAESLSSRRAPSSKSPRPPTGGEGQGGGVSPPGELFEYCAGALSAAGATCDCDPLTPALSPVPGARGNKEGGEGEM